MNNNCSTTHFPDTSERIFYKPIKVGTTRQKGTRLLQLSGSRLALRRDFWCVWGGWYQSSTVTCVWTSSLSVFAPSFTLAPIPQGLDAFPSRWRLIRGQLVRDTRVIVLTLTVGHWNANREHSKPNGVEEQQIFGQDFFFFFRWWSRSVYGRWNKVRADGHSVRRAFIWTVRKSNKSRQRYLWKEERKGWGWLFNLLSLKKWTKGRPEEERAHDYSSSNQYSEKWVSLQDSFPPVKPHITQWNSVMSGSVSVTDPLRVAQAEPG